MTAEEKNEKQEIKKAILDIAYNSTIREGLQWTKDLIKLAKLQGQETTGEAAHDAEKIHEIAEQAAQALEYLVFIKNNRNK